MDFEFFEEDEEENKIKDFEFFEPATAMPATGADTGGATLTMLPPQTRIQSLSLKGDYERKTLEQEGVSSRMRGIGEVPKEYSLEGVTTDLSKANKNV